MGAPRIKKKNTPAPLKAVPLPPASAASRIQISTLQRALLLEMGQARAEAEREVQHAATLFALAQRTETKMLQQIVGDAGAAVPQGHQAQIIEEAGQFYLVFVVQPQAAQDLAPAK